FHQSFAKSTKTEPNRPTNSRAVTMAGMVSAPMLNAATRGANRAGDTEGAAMPPSVEVTSCSITDVGWVGSGLIPAQMAAQHTPSGLVSRRPDCDAGYKDSLAGVSRSALMRRHADSAIAVGARPSP